MKKFWSSVFVAFLLTVLFTSGVRAETYGNLTYSISDGEVTITDCDTSATFVTIPETIDGYPVRSIGSYAFYNCGITLISIPSSVTSMGEGAFSDCYELSSVHISDLDAWCRIDFADMKATPLWVATLYVNGESPTEVILPDGMTAIKDYTFYRLRNLTSITIPDSVTSIGEEAFYGCKNLTNIAIPDNVTRIGGAAFHNTPWYEAKPNGLIYINKVLYRYKGNMPSNTKIDIIPGTVSISDSAFDGYSELTSITIPDGVTSIGTWAFSDCTGLTSITVPNSVTNISARVFSGCTGLTNVTLGNSVTNIGNFAFSDCTGLASIAFPSSVTSIGWNAFNSCTSLTSVTIPGSVMDIGDSTFAYCTGLTSVTIGNGVTNIGTSVFEGCNSLTSITIPDGVISIGESALRGCTSLTSVTIPDSVTSIGESALRDCTSLTSVTIPDSVTSIGACAFADCTDLTSVTIPISVTSIGWNAFKSVSSVYTYDLSAWCKINFKSNPFTDHSLYVNGTRVEQLILPSGISTISSYTFAKTSGIKSVVIPKDVKIISQYAFDGCNSITEIYYTGTTDEWERVRIADNNGSLSTATVYTDYVPDAMKITFSANTADALSPFSVKRQS